MAQKEAQLDDLITKVTEYLKEKLSIKAIVLFGSQVSGESTEFSDIDLAIFSKDVEDWDIEQRADTIVQIHQLFGSDIEPHFFAARLLKESRPTNFVGYILKTGRRIV